MSKAPVEGVEVLEGVWSWIVVGLLSHLSVMSNAAAIWGQITEATTDDFVLILAMVAVFDLDTDEGLRMP